MIGDLSDFLDQFARQIKQRKILYTLATVFGILAPILQPINNWLILTGVYFGLLVLIITMTSYWDYWQETKNRREFLSHLEANRSTGVIVEKKEANAQIKPDGEDELEFSFDISAADERPINTYYAICGTTEDKGWEDMDVDIEGGEINQEPPNRYVTDEAIVYLMKIDIEGDPVTSDEERSLSYSLTNDVLDLEEDFVSLVFREPTKRARIEIEIPEEYEFERGWAEFGNGDFEMCRGENQPRVDDHQVTWDLNADDEIIPIEREYKVWWSANQVAEN